MASSTPADPTGPSEMRIPIAGDEGIVAARGAAREVAKALDFGVVDQSRIATAVSELARNIVRYATDRRGEVVVRALAASARGEGPGIADLDQALAEGFSSSAGMGMGLPGTRRLMDEMEIDTAPGRGTTVTIRKWHR